MEKSIITIIITVYNREKFLDKCIKSVLDQTDVPTEILIIDDGSTDRSLEICRSYEQQHSNIKVFSQKNSGLAVARNTGIDNANGDYICFLDDDDIMTPGSLKTMLDAMETHDVDLVAGNFERYKEDGSFLSRNQMPDFVINKVITADEYWTASFDKRSYFIFIVNWAKLYKKEIWEGLRFPLDFRKAQDEYVMADILERCKKIYVTDYVVHNQTMTVISTTRSGFCQNTLRAPETKLVTTEKLIRQKKYLFAVSKWSIACGEIINYTKQVRSKELLEEIKRLYHISVIQGKELYRYFETKKKIKFLGYLILCPCFIYFA